MNAKTKLFAITMLSLFCMGCKTTIQNPPAETVCGLESVVGVVTNESGEPLEGIRIEGYLDENLTKHYPSDDWYLLSDEEKTTYADKEPVLYTDKEGMYTMARVAQYGLTTLDVYVVAIDNSNTYKKQIQKSQIEYVEVIGTTEEQKLVGGSAEVNFVLEKN